MNWPRLDRSKTPLGLLALTTNAAPRPYAGGTARFQHVEPSVAAPPAPEVDAQLVAAVLALFRPAINVHGDLEFELPNGERINLGRVRGKDGLEGYKPKKGKDYEDGRTPVKGVDYDDGKDGVGIRNVVRQGDNLAVNLTDGRTINLGRIVGEPGKNGDDGKDGDPGKDGDAGVGIKVGPFIRGGHLILQLTDNRIVDCGKLPVADPLPALKGEKGERGDAGPMPRHQLSADGGALRFEQSPGKFGTWIRLRSMVRELVRDAVRRLPKPERAIAGGGLSEARVLELIAANAGSSGQEDLITVTYVSSTDNRPSRIVRDADEDRFDWGTGAAGTYQYKGSAPKNTATSAAAWTVWRVTLDSAARPSVRSKATGVVWDSRASATYP